jgi:anti-sigma factor RsiW
MTRRHEPDVDAAAYVSGIMQRRERRRFERHLLTCEMCWREVRLDHEGRRLAELGRGAAPAGLREAVRAAVARGPVRDAAVLDIASAAPARRSGMPGRYAWMVPAVAAAVSLLVVAGSMLCL